MDDHPIVRKGIAELINSEADLQVCGEAATMQEAMSLASKLKPGLLIVDISLDGNNGVELMKNLSGRPARRPFWRIRCTMSRSTPSAVFAPGPRDT